VGFDDPVFARTKAEYVVENGFGGAALWTADLDDFNNLCCQVMISTFLLLLLVSNTV
jgi:GH18 family chitinase